MKSYYCQELCCNYKIIPYTKKQYYQQNKYPEIKIRKAGIFIYDSSSKKILLVQSRGQLWGSPKGSIKENEETIDCAVREVKEETGLEIEQKELSDFIIINGKIQYYFLKMNETDVNVQKHIEDNDANGIGWFNVECLYNLVDNGTININQHCRILVKKVFDKDIPFNKSIIKRNNKY